MSLLNLTLVLFSVVMSTGAQLILKVGANRINDLVASQDKGLSIISLIPSYLNVYIIVALLIYFISAAMWVLVLTRVEISIAYPFISIGFIMTLVFGVVFFGESISLGKVFGTSLIIIGCFFIAKSA